MEEAVRLGNLFENLYHGDPWIGVTLVTTLSTITAKQAQKRVLPNTNTIWEITHHLIYWRLNVLQRLRGKIIKTPENNYFEPIIDSSDKAWITTLKKLDHSQKKWITFLNEIKTDQFEKIYPGNQMTYYEHIQGIIQHDAYHLGQIALLGKNV